MGVKFSELPVLLPEDVTDQDYVAVLDTSEGVLKRTNVEIPVPTSKGGTGNSDGYIRTGRTPGTVAGQYSTIEGDSTAATAEASHAEGLYSRATGRAAHAEGGANTAQGSMSHAEGSMTSALGNYSHSEGHSTVASGDVSHAEGDSCTAEGHYSHAGGFHTVASHYYQTVIGFYNENNPTTIFEIGNGDTSQRKNAFEVYRTGDVYVSNDLNVMGSVYSASYKLTSGEELAVVEANPSQPGLTYLQSIKVGTTAYRIPSNIELPLSTRNGGTGNNDGYIRTGQKSGTTAGSSATIEGDYNTGSGDYSHAEGQSTTASGKWSHSEGTSTRAIGDCSHAEGDSSQAKGICSHAEGYSCTAEDYAHAEGYSCYADAYAHAEGYDCDAADYGHAEGYKCDAAQYAHAEGYDTTARGDYSHSTGYGTIADDYSYAGGKYAIAGGDYSFVMGVGASSSSRFGTNQNCMFAMGDNTYAKFSDTNLSGIISGPSAFGFNFRNTACSKNTSYDAKYGFCGTMTQPTFGTSINDYVKLINLEAGGIYMLTLVSYDNTNTSCDVYETVSFIILRGATYGLLVTTPFATSSITTNANYPSASGNDLVVYRLTKSGSYLPTQFTLIRLA